MSGRTGVRGEEGGGEGKRGLVQERHMSWVGGRNRFDEEEACIKRGWLQLMGTRDGRAGG